MLITKKAYLAAALTSASLAALAMPTSAWAQATPNVTDECAPAIESSAGLNPEAFDPVSRSQRKAGFGFPICNLVEARCNFGNNIVTLFMSVLGGRFLECPFWPELKFGLRKPRGARVK